MREYIQNRKRISDVPKNSVRLSDISVTAAVAIGLSTMYRHVRYRFKYNKYRYWLTSIIPKSYISKYKELKITLAISARAKQHDPLSYYETNTVCSLSQKAIYKTNRKEVI